MIDNNFNTELQEMKDRIRWIRKQNHLSQVDFAKALNVSQSVISLIESGNASVSIEILKRLSSKFDLSCDWLIYGQDRYVRLSSDNNFIPLVDAEAEAGYISGTSDATSMDSLQLYKIPGFENGQFRIFEVAGDSMLPSLHAKDKIICDRLSNHNELVEGSIYVVVTQKNIVVKRVYFSQGDRNSLLFKSDNRHYADERLPVNEALELWTLRAKITSSFIDQSFAQNERMDFLEEDLNKIKEQVSLLLKKSSAKSAPTPETTDPDQVSDFSAKKN